MSSNAIHEWIKARVPDYIEVISYQVKATDITSKAISSKVRALDNWVTEVRAYTHQHAMRFLNLPVAPKSRSCGSFHRVL